MKTELTAQRLRELLHYCPDTGVFTRKLARSPRVKVGEVAGFQHSQGYVALSVGEGGLQLAHRLAWLYVHGNWPVGVIDHVNGVKTDNRIANLRDVSPRRNQQNRRNPAVTNKSTGVLGVVKDGTATRPFAVRLVDDDGVRRDVGRFATLEEAKAAYLVAKRDLQPGCTL